VKLLLARVLRTLGLLGLVVYSGGWFVYPVEGGISYNVMCLLFRDNAVPF
jgi:hypothetical protein